MNEYELSDWQHCTAVAALIHYALHVADPDACIETLWALVPHPIKPWEDSIREARASYRAILDRAAEAAAA